MKNVIFLAPPAAGKGTFSELLIQKYGYQHISSGELLRDEALKNNELDKDLENGQLISDEVVMKLVVDKLHSSFSNSNFILDGIPRTFNQVHLLEQYIQLDQFVVIYIHVDKSVLLKRVLGRRVCPNCEKNYNVSFEKFRPEVENVCDVCSSSLIKRTDDTEEAFLKRYQTYIERIKPILEYYQNKGILYTISNNSEDQTEALRKLVDVIHDN